MPLTESSVCVQHTAPDKIPATRDDIGRVDPIGPRSLADIVLLNLGDARRMIIPGIVEPGLEYLPKFFMRCGAQGNRIKEPTVHLREVKVSCGRMVGYSEVTAKKAAGWVNF